MTTEDFLNFASARTGHDVTGLLTPWLYEERLPGVSLRRLSDPRLTSRPGGSALRA